MDSQEVQGLGVGDRKINLEDVTNSQLAHVIDEYIHSERDREILKHRLIDGYTFAKLADVYYPLSERRLKSIVYKAQRTLFKHLS